MVVALPVRLLPLSQTHCDREKLFFQEANTLDCWEAEIYKKLYIKPECCSLNRKDCGHTLSGADRKVHFLSEWKQWAQTAKLPISKTLTKNLKPHSGFFFLIFQGTAMFDLLRTAAARFAKSGEIMLLLDLVEVEFSLSLEPQ